MSNIQATPANRYATGKIYKIYVLGSDVCYIGSTCGPLTKRMAAHRADYKRFLAGKFNYISSFEILKLDGAVITLVEDFPCERKDQLIARERHYVETINCVNKHKPGAYLAAGSKAAYYNEIVKCVVCKCESTRGNISTHNKTQKHIRNSNSSISSTSSEPIADAMERLVVE